MQVVRLMHGRGIESFLYRKTVGAPDEIRVRMRLERRAKMTYQELPLGTGLRFG